MGSKSERVLSTTALSHEVGHLFGIIGIGATATSVAIFGKGGNLSGINMVDNGIADVQINTANSYLRDGKAEEGIAWVDNYKTHRNRNLAYPIFGSKELARTPSVIDIYRAGARRIRDQQR